MKLLNEFKSFAMKGNVIDLAVGVVIGTAFGKIVSSLVADIITPTLGVLVGGVDFTKWGYSTTTLAGGEVMIAYGKFLQTMFDFIIIAFSIFIVIKILNKAQEKVIKKAEKDDKKEVVKKSDDLIVLEEIRDLLKSTKGSSKKEVIEKNITEVIVEKATPKKSIQKTKKPIEKTTKKSTK